MKVKRLFFPLVISIVTFLIIILIVLGNILYSGYKYRYQELSKDIKYVLILGSRLNNDNITETLKNRLNKALEYKGYNENLKFIVSGGNAPDSTITEAEAMRDYLIFNGIKKDDIILEEKAQSTFDNIKYTKNLLSKIENNMPSILIVTSDFHVARALMISKSFNLDAYGLSSVTPSNMSFKFITREIFAFIKDYIKCLCAA